MKSCVTLPEGYSEAFGIDLAKDKKLFILVNVLALVLAVPPVVLGALVVPFPAMLEGDDLAFPLRLIVMGLGMMVYIVLHEAVHGIVMWHYSHVKPRFGLSLSYAYAGSDCYFAKKPYLVIALAPVVVWGVVLTVVSALVPQSLFWVFWMIQIVNISGAAGDLYVTWRFAGLPQDILVQDTGVAMKVFAKE